MDKIKAYYCKEKGGYILFMPDGAEIPCAQRVIVDDQWEGHTSAPSVSVTVTFLAEGVNEPPVQIGQDGKCGPDQPFVPSFPEDRFTVY